MQMHTTVMWTDWVAGVPNVGKGLNDFLALVPRLPMDAAPPPALLHFADPFRDVRCARWYNGVEDGGPNKFGALYITPDGPAPAQGEAHATFREWASARFAARVILQGANIDKNARYAEYYCRALAMSTEAWLAESNDARAGRQLGSIAVTSANQQLHGPWSEDVGEGIALGVFSLDLVVRDYAPRG